MTLQLKSQGRLKRRVFVGAGLAMIVVAAWALWSRAHVPDPGALPHGPEAFVRVTAPGGGAVDQVLKERASLYDPTPLFFPTEWNYGQRQLPAGLRRQPGQVFGSFEPKYTFDGPAMKVYGAESSPAPEKLSDVLVQGNEAPFAGFGQIDVTRSTLEARAAAMEVRELGSSKIAISQSFAEFKSPRLDYAPIEFLIVVGSAGIIGDPVLTSGSGWEEVDSFVRGYIVKEFRLGQRLTPGRYRVVVGP
jgi:hypothetical protein